MNTVMSGKFWVGLILGLVLYHLYLMKMQKKSG